MQKFDCACIISYKLISLYAINNYFINNKYIEFINKFHILIVMFYS